jgi:hypothetical protein
MRGYGHAGHAGVGMQGPFPPAEAFSWWGGGWGEVGKLHLTLRITRPPHTPPPQNALFVGELVPAVGRHHGHGARLSRGWLGN